jgi:hypothetical protein
VNLLPLAKLRGDGRVEEIDALRFSCHKLKFNPTAADDPGELGQQQNTSQTLHPPKGCGSCDDGEPEQEDLREGQSGIVQAKE